MGNGRRGRSSPNSDDWTFVAQCTANGSDHLSLRARATDAELARDEAAPIDACPYCGGDLDVSKHLDARDVLADP